MNTIQQVRAPRARWKAILALAIGLISSAWFFREFWLSGFRLTQGSDVDGRVIVLQSIQWWQPTAFGSPLDVGIFYPAAATLGTTDALLLFGLGSWPLSFLLDTPQVAVQVFLIALSLVGYASWLFLFRRQLGIQWPISIVGSLLLTFGHPIYVISGNFKMLAVWLIPLPIVLLAASLQSRDRRWTIAWGVVAGMMLGLVALTSVVVVWFELIAVALTAVVWILLGFGFRISSWPSLRGSLASYLSALVGAATMIPALLVTYIPNLGSTGAASSGTGFALAIRFLELVNVSDTNALWGSIFGGLPQDLIRSSISDSLPEWQLAPTPLILILALIFLAIGLWNIRSLTAHALLGVASLIAGFFFWLIPVRDFVPLPTGGSVFFFPWSFVQHLPGADGIRYISRFEIFAFMLLVFGIVLVANWYLIREQVNPKRRRVELVAVGMLVPLVLLEQVNTRPMQETDISWWDEIRSIPVPPDECDSFALIDEFPDRIYAWATMNDARAIAWLYQIPSINGFSSVSPPGWDVERVDEDSYRKRLDEWLIDSDVTETCLLSLQERQWEIYDPSGHSS